MAVRTCTNSRGTPVSSSIPMAPVRIMANMMAYMAVATTLLLANADHDAIIRVVGLDPRHKAVLDAAHDHQGPSQGRKSPLTSMALVKFSSLGQPPMREKMEF